MIKVYQTKTGVGGNCFQAAIASILEQKLCDIPDFCNEYAEDEYYDQFVLWLNHRGLTAVPITFNAKQDNKYFNNAYYIASGIAKCSGLRHCVIYKGNTQVHNPNRKCEDEIINIDMVDIIFPLDIIRD